MDVRQGNMTSGKLTATERTNPSFIVSTTKEGGNDVRMFPPTSEDPKVI